MRMGFAHCRSAPTCSTKCTEIRYADDEYGLLWNDPDLAIAWPVEDPW